MGAGLFSMPNEGQFERKGRREDLKKKKKENKETIQHSICREEKTISMPLIKNVLNQLTLI